MDDSALLTAVLEQLGSLRTDITNRFIALEARIDNRCNKCDDRISNLELWRSWLFGAFAVVSTGLTVAFTWWKK